MTDDIYEEISLSEEARTNEFKHRQDIGTYHKSRTSLMKIKKRKKIDKKCKTYIRRFSRAANGYYFN